MLHERCVVCLCINFPVKFDDDIFDGYITKIRKINSNYLGLLYALRRGDTSHGSLYLVKNDTFSSRKVED